MATHHIDDDDLELHALERLAGTAPLEEHLLLCEECRERLADLDKSLRDPQHFPIEE